MEMGGKSEGEKEAEDRERWKRRTGCLKVKIEMSKLVKSQRSNYLCYDEKPRTGIPRRAFRSMLVDAK